MDNYNEEMYGDRYPDLVFPKDLTSACNTEMNTGWMRENPELAVEAIIKFFEENPDKHFTYGLGCRFVPNRDRETMKLGYVTLYAKRKGK